jgi:eukaryotic-like serine/threonine-protein kinase
VGDKAAADADTAEGLRREPTDVGSWTARGFARYQSDPAGAIADYDAALKLDPRSNVALQSKAAILADHLKRPDEAVAVLDTLVGMYPHYTEARAARAVYLARVGETKRAKEDLAVVLKEEPSPPRLYQAACVYALLSKADGTGAYRQEALQYLARAFRAGFVKFDLVGRDPDLDPVRNDADFKDIVRHAKSWREAGN